MRAITLKAFAKINLFLDILNKRPDGYHNIVTMFQRIALYDTIKVKKSSKGISLSCNSSDIPSGKNNIVYKAAKIMKAEFGIKSGLDISLRKRIPAAAGLGGGSSDAAAVIKAINLIFNLNLSARKLTTIAADIGADVPFFLTDESCAIGRGIGERLKVVSKVLNSYVLLVLPKLKISTKSIYAKVTLPLTKAHSNVNIISRSLKFGKSCNLLGSLLFNRLEEVVFLSYPVVAEIKAIVSSTEPSGVLLSGSGPAVFGLFASRKEALRAKRKISLQNNCWRFILTQTC